MINEPTIAITNTTTLVKRVKPKLIYGYDTLCGWCYGFSDELNKSIKILGDEIDFELVNSGLFAGVRGPKMGYISAHIKRHMQYVTDRTGKEFGQGFLSLLENVNYPYNSMKASIAIKIINDLKPSKVFDFAAQIQEAFFKNGEDIQSDQFYVNLVSSYQIDVDLFLEKLHSQKYEQKIQESFYKAQQYGFSGYPACAIKIGNNTKILTQGFVNADQFTSLVRSELNK